MFSVSVVIPSYNSRALVTRAIDSVLAQTRPAAEIIVVDDGSQDGTGEELRQRYGARIRYVYQPNAGPSSARNRGISLGSSRWIAFLDADDTWLPEKLELQAEALRSEAQAVMAVCGCIKVLPDGTRVGETRLPVPLDAAGIRRELRHRTLFPMNGVIVRKDVLDECGGFDDQLCCGEDRDLWVRVATQGPVAAVHRPLAVQLVLPDSVSTNPGRTLRDGLIVNRRAALVLGDPGPGTLSRVFALRRADARLYFSVAWLHSCRGQRFEALVALAHSCWLCPWPGLLETKRRAGLLLRLALGAPFES